MSHLQNIYTSKEYSYCNVLICQATERTPLYQEYTSLSLAFLKKRKAICDLEWFPTDKHSHREEFQLTEEITGRKGQKQIASDQSQFQCREKQLENGLGLETILDI